MSVSYTAGYESAAFFPLTFPRILWDALPVVNVISSGAAPGHSADRVVVPDTATWWQSTTGSPSRTLTLDFGALKPLDAVGIAGHNLGGDQIVLEGATDVGLTTWSVLDTLTPTDDSSLLALVTPGDYYGLRISITAADVGAPSIISSVYVGEALVLPARGYGDIEPIDLGMDVQISSYRSESGQLAGRFVTYTGLRGSFYYSHIPEPWVRAYLIPFFKGAIVRPFFIANRPDGYPTECGYCWTSGNVVPQRMKMKNFMAFKLEVDAHAPASLF